MTSVTASAQPRSKPLRADAARNRARILVAAEEVLAEKGAAAGIDDVAAAAGVGVGTLYRHFPTKEALIEAILLVRLGRMVEEGRGYLSAERPGEALFAFLASFVAQSQQKQDLLDSLAKGIDHEQLYESDGARAVLEEMAGVVGELLAAAQAAGEVRADVSVDDLIGLTLGPCMANGNPLIASCDPTRMMAVVRAGLRPE